MLPEDLEVVHQPTRLAIVVMLYKQGDVSAVAARATLGLTPGNLDAHVRRLAAAGLVSARRVLTGDGFELRMRLTRHGLDAMQRYLEWLADVQETLALGRG